MLEVKTVCNILMEGREVVCDARLCKLQEMLPKTICGIN